MPLLRRGNRSSRSSRSGRGRSGRSNFRGLLRGLFRSLRLGVWLRRRRLASVTAASHERNRQERQQRYQCQIPHSQSPFKKTLMPIRTVRAVTLVTATWPTRIVTSPFRDARKTSRLRGLGRTAPAAPLRPAAGPRSGYAGVWSPTVRLLTPAPAAPITSRSLPARRGRSRVPGSP